MFAVQKGRRKENGNEDEQQHEMDRELPERNSFVAGRLKGLRIHGMEFIAPARVRASRVRRITTPLRTLG